MLIKRKLPENLKATDEKYFSKEFERHIAEPSSLVIENAFVNHEGVVFSKTKIVKQSLVADGRNPFTFFSLVKQIVKNQRVYSPKKEAVAVVSDYWYSGYFHWITDTLPRLVFLMRTNPEAVPMIPRDERFSYIEKSLLPFRFRKIIFLRKDECLFIKNLLLVKHTALSGNYNEEIIREIRGIFRAYFRSEENHGFDKIYVSRSKSARRRIINESAVSTLLKEFGFITVHFEDYEFEDQVKIASRSKYLIGLHGAGLTNMIFMSARASVLEFRPENDDSNLCYYALASALDLKYYYQFGRSLVKIDYNDDVEIDLSELRKNVELILKKDEACH